MALIRELSIERFRGIRSLMWRPAPGMNCLIGPGDSGKSTVLTAIDWCLGQRRSLPVSDADFTDLDVAEPIRIRCTIGALANRLVNLERYGYCLCGWSEDTGLVDESDPTLEDVLVVELEIANDLQPLWQLISERAEQGNQRMLTWHDRAIIAPTVIGRYTDRHLGFQTGSILARLSDETPDMAAAFAGAAREARQVFYKNADQTHLAEVLRTVGDAAKRLGILENPAVIAALDAQTLTSSGGTLSLHDADSRPLRGLGLGSSRLLVAELQRTAGSEAPVALVDEAEHGLEPHRLIRFLQSLGVKRAEQIQQVFMTTHSPVVLRELACHQLSVLRAAGDKHLVLSAADEANQGTLRSCPEAFLGQRVIVCEGATEVGLIRGLDRYYHENTPGHWLELGSTATVLIDAQGVDKIHNVTYPLQQLGYAVAVMRDDDKQPSAELEARFAERGGKTFCWSEQRCTEQAWFHELPDSQVLQLYELAGEIHDPEEVRHALQSSTGAIDDLDAWFMAMDPQKREQLAVVAKGKKNSWFKKIDYAERAGFDVIGPVLMATDSNLRSTVDALFNWVGSAPGAVEHDA